MQKVVGSSPISRSLNASQKRGFVVPGPRLAIDSGDGYQNRLPNRYHSDHSSASSTQRSTYPERSSSSIVSRLSSRQLTVLLGSVRWNSCVAVTTYAVH